MMSKIAGNRHFEAIAPPVSDPQRNYDVACGDHELSRSESGVELKSLLKLIDNEIKMSPATDDEDFINGAHFPQGDGRVTISETLLVPVKKFPKYNFVGRILGPRGMTVKQLEKETGCKIFVKGRASNNTFNPQAKSCRPTPPPPSKITLSQISRGALTEEPLHVYIECTDYPMIATNKMAHAVSIVNDLLSPPVDGKDELKRQQLVDISLINGTYRATSSSNDLVHQYRRHPWRQTVDPTSNPADTEVPENSNANDLGSVYGIAQQRRVWQKPRGPDTFSEEYAKSVSSREYVTDIVNKTKKSPVKNASNDSLYTLPQSVVSETLKVAKNLLASHQNMTINHTDKPVDSMFGAGDVRGIIKCGDYSHPLPPPPPLMSSQCFPHPSGSLYLPPPFPEYPMFCMMPPPPVPPHIFRRF